MNQFTLVLLDTSGIQRYIFDSNRLQEIVGASQLVYEATQDWPYKILEDLFSGGHNIDPKTGQLSQERHIEKDQSLQVEMIYAGGGNTALIFRERKDAIEFSQRLTLKTLIDAPGLNLLVVLRDFDWDAASLAQEVQQAIDHDLSIKKHNRKPSLPQLGLGVSAVCDSTGLPACGTNQRLRLPTEINERPRLISPEIAAKLRARDRANERLKMMFADQLDGWFSFPHDFDQLGRRMGEESYVAVVHADGNNMGKRVQKLYQHFLSAANNREYITAMRHFSSSANQAGVTALRTVVTDLARQRPEEANTSYHILPIRPIVYGGDDVTLACQGRFGLAIAARFLEVFDQQKLQGMNDGDDVLHACAGVCIVKMHYPFSLAYQLSEELAASAKKFVRDTVAAVSETDFAALDWHISTTGLVGDLEEIRRRAYQVEAGSLLMRPLRLYPVTQDGDGRAWYKRMETLVTQFKCGQDWADRRNKVKDLREALRAGPKAVSKFRTTYRLPLLPEIIPDANIYRENGWDGRRCGYFDAIELMDHYDDIR